MAYTAQNLEHAVSVFYSSEHSERAEAHKWLTEAQRCPEAWSFVWELLNSQKSTEIQFFAATTLHTKLQRCWAEVPPDSYEELKNRIMHAILAAFNGPKIVLNRLCISLAAFILQQRGQGLLETVNQLSGAQNASLLIEILSVIPEEFNSMIIKNRSVVRGNLQQFTTQILDLVMNHLQNEDISKEMTDSHWLYQVGLWQGACQCAGAWIQLCGVTPAQCIPVVTSALQVLYRIYSGNKKAGEPRGELCQAELEACEAALNTAAAALTQPDAGRYPTVCCQLLKLLLDAVEPLLQAEDVLHAPNEDLMVALYSTLVVAGEFHGRWIATSLVEEDFSNIDESNSEQVQIKQESTRCAKILLQLLLCCSGAAGIYPTQETHSKLAFSFWFTLQDEGLWTSKEVNSNTVKQALRPWYEQLVVILIRKSMFTPSHSEFTAEDEELMRCYRQDIGDTLVYCHTVLGNSLVLQLENHMNNILENCLSDGGCALEADMHAFLSLAEFVHASVSSSILSLMKILTTLPYDKLHKQVLITALSCFVAYADWLGSYENPAVEEIVGRALTITWMAVEKKELSSLGVFALKALCKECNKYLQPHAHQLLQAFQSGQSKWSSLVASQMMRAAGCAAASLTPSEAAPYLTNLVTPIVVKLQAAKKKQMSSRQITQCSNALQQASALLLSLLECEIKHAYVPLTLLLPCFSDLVQYPTLTEPLFKLIKLIITRLQDECMPLLPELIQVTSKSLEVYPHPSNVEVCKMMSLMVPEVGGDAITAAATAVLRISSETVTQGQSLSNHAPLLDTFYSALAVILSKKPHVLQNLEPQMQNIIQLGLLILSLQEQGPSKSACNFFGNLSKAQPDKLLPHCQALVHRIIHCIGILVPRNHIDPFSELFWKLARNNWTEPSNNDDSVSIQGPTELCNWLKNALQEPGFPTELATPAVKDVFVKGVVKNFSHKRRLMETIREFTLSCRGLLSTYGEMTQPLDNF